VLPVHAGMNKNSRTGIFIDSAAPMIHIDTIHTLGQSLRAARKQLGLTQAQLALAAGVGLRFIVELEAVKPPCGSNMCCASSTRWAANSAWADFPRPRVIPSPQMPCRTRTIAPAMLNGIRRWTNWLPRPRRSKWGTSSRSPHSPMSDEGRWRSLASVLRTAPGIGAVLKPRHIGCKWAS
jgi:hypothetical protein